MNWQHSKCGRSAGVDGGKRKRVKEISISYAITKAPNLIAFSLIDILRLGTFSLARASERLRPTSRVFFQPNADLFSLSRLPFDALASWSSSSSSWSFICLSVCCWPVLCLVKPFVCLFVCLLVAKTWFVELKSGQLFGIKSCSWRVLHVFFALCCPIPIPILIPILILILILILTSMSMLLRHNEQAKRRRQQQR